MAKKKFMEPMFTVGDYVRNNHWGSVYKVTDIRGYREYVGHEYWCVDHSGRTHTIEPVEEDRYTKINATPITLGGNCIAFATDEELLALAALVDSARSRV